jgi:hypothetical protein
MDIDMRSKTLPNLTTLTRGDLILLERRVRVHRRGTPHTINSTPMAAGTERRKKVKRMVRSVIISDHSPATSTTTTTTTVIRKVRPSSSCIFTDTKLANFELKCGRRVQ